MPLSGQKLAPMVELNGWPAGWFERYVEAEHAAVDGVCIYSAKTVRGSGKVVGYGRFKTCRRRGDGVRHLERLRCTDAQHSPLAIRAVVCLLREVLHPLATPSSATGDHGGLCRHVDPGLGG
ncbi:hypothetical protein [Mesorhizobium sp.]|uniref:hypothetical protein n=1 Tax=Mesorhizobium sp. TaxID=1871066 RepID=UPI0025E8F1BD|nr:hypothetical protein [Mesorhizobium sp.]